MPLGPDLAKATRKWAELEDQGADKLSVADLVQTYIDREDRPRSTLLQYLGYLKALTVAFPIPASELRSQTVAIWRDLPKQRERKDYTNGCLAVLMAACKLGHEKGLCDFIKVERWNVTGRDYYLDDNDFRRIRSHASAWLKVAMDLAYLTAARPCDIRALKWEQVGDSLGMRQKKTLQRMAFTMSNDLASVLTDARQRRVLGLYVCATEKGKRISRTRFDDDWHAACEAANVEGVQFRDIRAKAANDAKRGGQNFQALLGHTTRAMSERRIKGRQTVVADPVRRKL